VTAAERDAFLATMLPRQIRAEVAIHNGDVTPRLSTWSRCDPVTVFGAAVPFSSGWAAVRSVFDWVATSFTSCDDYDFEVLAADARGDVAYTVGVERYQARTAAGTTVDNELRVTHVYRREPEGWRIVHRHGDHMPADAMRRSGLRGGDGLGPPTG
jgi:ketosteroid isomerase-like protein